MGQWMPWGSGCSGTMAVGQGMLWDRNTVALRMQEACRCHGAGSAMGRGCGMLWVSAAVVQCCCAVQSCVPGLMSYGCVLARVGNGFEACWYLLRVLTAPQGQFH